MPITDRPGNVPPGAQPWVPGYPIPPGFVPPPIVTPETGASNLTPPGSTGVSPGTQAPIQGVDGFFGFFLLLMGLK